MKTNYSYAFVSWVFVILAYSGFMFIEDDKKILLTNEDGFFETAGALFFLLAGICFLISFFIKKSPQKRFLFKQKRNIFFLLLGILFLFGFFEEISWGQRLLNIQTPLILEEINMQEEINFHNLSFFEGTTEEGTKKNFFLLFLSFDRLFSVFWLLFCFLIPILFQYNNQAKSFLQNIYLPIIPISIGILFLANYFFSKLLKLLLHDQFIINDALVEVKESLFAFLFFVVSIWFMRNYSVRKI